MDAPKGITKKNLKKFRNVLADLVERIYDWKPDFDDVDYQWECVWAPGIDMRDAIDRILRDEKSRRKKNVQLRKR